MGIGEWLSNNGFNFLSAIGVIFSLAFTAKALRSETKTRRIGNLLSITANYRELWATYLDDKELVRVRDMSAKQTLPLYLSICCQSC